MTTFEKELKKMFGSCDFITDQTYSGKTMLGRLDDDLRIKISFVTTGYADHYSALRVKIINRTEGEVDSETFKFGDIIGKQNTSISRIDPYIWSYNGKDEWYLPITDSQRELIADTVTDYASLYLDEGMIMQ